MEVIEDLPMDDSYHRCTKIYKKRGRGRRRGEQCMGVAISEELPYCELHRASQKKKKKKKPHHHVIAAVCNCCSNNIDDDVFSTVKLVCGHNFHFQCIMILLRDPSGVIIKYDDCPICQHKILEEMERECPICLESLIEGIVKTTCSHFYHKDCLNTWKRTRHNCPMCRKKI